MEKVADAAEEEDAEESEKGNVAGLHRRRGLLVRGLAALRVVAHGAELFTEGQTRKKDRVFIDRNDAETKKIEKITNCIRRT